MNLPKERDKPVMYTLLWLVARYKFMLLPSTHRGLDKVTDFSDTQGSCTKNLKNVNKKGT